MRLDAVHRGSGSAVLAAMVALFVLEIIWQWSFGPFLPELATPTTNASCGKLGQLGTSQDFLLSVTLWASGSVASLALWNLQSAFDPRYSVRYSITSSARSWMAVDSSTPIAFAVLRLMTSSNFTACSTGRSAGFAPLSILDT
jgi:hypothetical protein